MPPTTGRESSCILGAWAGFGRWNSGCWRCAIAVPWQDQLLAGRQGSCSELWAHKAKVWAGQSQSPRSCSHLTLQQQLRLLKETTLLTAVCKSNRWFLQIPALPITFITSSSCPLPTAGFCLLVLHSLANKCSWLLQQEGRIIFVFTAQINYWLCLVLSSVRRWQHLWPVPALTSHGAGDPWLLSVPPVLQLQPVKPYKPQQCHTHSNTKHLQTPCPLFRERESCGGQAEHSQRVILAVSNPSLFLTVASHALIHFWCGQKLCRAGSCFGLQF